MGFIELFFKDKKEIKETDVNLFISQRIEENINLDYKDIRAYRDADDLAIHIASFANSEGGLIILGISQDEIKDEKGRITKIYPKEITWGEISYDKESLENKLITRIKPTVPGLVIRPVRNEKDGIIFLIDIPKSNIAPHMSPDNRYNKRLNFGRYPMEHYEVTALFRINWTQKEKLVEKIYVPLSSILEKHAQELNDFVCPSSFEIDEIMKQTYYKTQMPSDLRDRIDYYVDQVENLRKHEYHARKAMIKILNINVLTYFKKAYSPLSDELQIGFKAGAKTGSLTDLYFQIIIGILLKNQKIRDYLVKTCWSNTYEWISITSSNETNAENIDKFDEIVWSKCLRDVSENAEILQMKKNAEILLSEAWDLIEEITHF